MSIQFKCRYDDCVGGNPICPEEEQVTCPHCREYIGLDPVVVSTEVPGAHLRCPENLVKELTSNNSMLAETINPSGVCRLAADWLDMKTEISDLRNRINTLEGAK